MFYKVLLADDEKIIRDGIASLIDWKAHDLVLAGTARNGNEAYKMITELNPDIVITDIKMQGMDGLELITRVKERIPETVFVILSGYGEFDFAQKAMQYGVKHYLLKPTNEEEIEKVLSEVIIELQTKKAKGKYINKIKRNLKKVMPLVREQFLRDCVMDRSYTNAERAYYRKLLGLSEERIRLILFQPEGDFNFESLFALKIISESIFGRDRIYLNTSLRNQVLILTQAEDEETLLKMLHSIKETFLEYYALDLTISISKDGAFENIPGMYNQAREFLEYRFYLGEGSIITRSDVHTDERIEDESLVFDYDRVAMSVKNGNISNLNSELDNFFYELSSVKRSIQIARTYCMEMFMAVIRNARVEKIEEHSKKIVQMQQLETLKQIHTFIKDIAGVIAEENHKNIKVKHHRFINILIKYVMNNIGNEELSVKWVAHNVIYMNVDYLGRLFKKETGDSFSHYIMKIRMEKAKELIENIENNENYRINEIAEKVGFGINSQYFSQVFKKYTGLSPSEYKKKLFKHRV